MYINYKILESKQLTLKEFAILQLIKQNKTEDLSAQIEEQCIDTTIIENLAEKGYIEYIKPKNKSENQWKLLRASKKGVQVLEDIDTPACTDEVLKMRDYLVEMYLNHEDTERTIGNKKSIAIYISILQHHLAINIYQFYYLCEYFLSEYPYTKKLENIFWDKNKHRYKEFKNNIEDSTIFQFYEEHKEDIENYWKQKIKQ